MKSECWPNSKSTSKYALPLVLTAIVLTQSACVSITPESSKIEGYLLNQQPEQALNAIESYQPEERDQSLYLLEKAMLLRMQNRFEDSNRVFEKAKKLTQQLDAISVREQAAAISVSDSLRSYLPPVFEQMLMHCFQAINYLQLQQYDGARVEILQLNELLKQKDDIQLPFAHLLSGLVFELNQELDSALISYRKAYQTYELYDSPIPLILKQDLLRLTDYLGLNEEHQVFLDEFALESWPDQQQINQQAHAIAFVFSGLIPRKHSFSINIREEEENKDEGEDGKNAQVHRISIPFYEQRAVRVNHAELSTQTSSANSELIAQLDKQASATLASEMPAIMLRTIARVSIKNKAVSETRKSSPLLSLALNIAGLITEQADTRAWNTLPQQILIMRLNLPAGSHDLTLKLSEATPPSAIQTWQQININKGESRVFSYHSPDSYVTNRDYNHEN